MQAGRPEEEPSSCAEESSVRAGGDRTVNETNVVGLRLLARPQAA
jgi:hypothetical protein